MIYPKRSRACADNRSSCETVECQNDGAVIPESGSDESLTGMVPSLGRVKLISGVGSSSRGFREASTDCIKLGM